MGNNEVPDESFKWQDLEKEVAARTTESTQLVSTFVEDISVSA